VRHHHSRATGCQRRPARRLQRGQIGAISTTDYLGNSELEAYTPLNVPDSDLHWSILATRDDSEALAGAKSFTKTLVVAMAAIVFVICVVAMVRAQIFVRPIRRLEAGVQRVSAGKYEVTVPVTSRDEIGDLTAAFNDMSRFWRSKAPPISSLSLGTRESLNTAPTKSCGTPVKCPPR
jgi:HAMP domain-containing protein